MKKMTIGVAAALGLACGTAWAQSSVTLYGLIDEGIRFSTNQPSPNGPANKLYMSEGIGTGNRWGIKGSEDLGGGTYAIFDLQSGFNPATGTSDQQGQLFGRYAYVGISNTKYGTLKLGRQYGTGFDFIATFDPVQVGNQNPVDWEIFLLGVRFDNTVQYSNTWGPVSFELQRSVGGEPGSVSQGSTTALNAIYTAGGLKVGVLGQQSKDSANHNMYAGSLGVRYAFAKAILYSYYIYTRRDAGFEIAANNTGGALANTNIIGNSATVAGPATQTKARIDNLVNLGGSYMPASDITFTVGGLYDHVTNVAGSQTGHIASFYGIADYLLSRRTDVYLEVDHSLLGGAEVTDPNSPIGTFAGENNSTSAMVALRTRF
ncbi:porin [Paraburkholderia kirstenboschensis]|uniref:Porin n=1 Tax=Paraburkholderia kirstenboschensis TaxID=1245436 RepID=A0ABZ0ELM6_9BURK|nr:porin [Paraburkholderia kirstenboschensis]WOD17003.1 porin [Paraburkholderia kirstenboschensis]